MYRFWKGLCQLWLTPCLISVLNSTVSECRKGELKKMPCQGQGLEARPGTERLRRSGRVQERNRSKGCRGASYLDVIPAKAWVQVLWGMGCALGVAIRDRPGKVCRNFLAGLVMLPGLEFWAGSSALFVTRPGSKRCLSSVKQPTALARPATERLRRAKEDINTCMGCRGRVPCPPEAFLSWRHGLLGLGGGQGCGRVFGPGVFGVAAAHFGANERVGVFPE